MAALISKPGLTGASALSIPTDWSEKWFRGFINNMLKGGDVRNALGVNGIKVSGNISSPYATIGFGAPVTLPGPVTISPPATSSTTALTVTAAPTSNAGNFIGNSGVPFLGAQHLAIRVAGATGTTDYSGIDFSSTNTNPMARIAAVFAGGGSSISLGTSNNYGTGITNTALTIDPTGNTTLTNGATGAAVLTVTASSPCRVAIIDTGSSVTNVIGTSSTPGGFLGTQTNHLLDIRTNNIVRASIAANGSTITGWGANAAALVDWAPDSGTFTGTLTGMTATITGTMTWVKVGNLVTIYSPGAMTGTSNTTAMTMTGLPAIIQVNATQLGICSVEDNSVNRPAFAQLSPGSGTVAFVGATVSGANVIFSAGAFTASGVKGLNATTFSYSLL